MVVVISSTRRAEVYTLAVWTRNAICCFACLEQLFVNLSSAAESTVLRCSGTKYPILLLALVHAVLLITHALFPNH